MKRLLLFLLCVGFLTGAMPVAQADEDARAAFIDGIIATAEQIFTQANGKLQRAQYSGDIYVCKN